MASDVADNTETIETGPGRFIITGIRCNLESGFHVAPCQGLLSFFVDFFKKTGIIAYIGNDRRWIGFNCIDEIFQALEEGKRHNELELKIKNLLYMLHIGVSGEESWDEMIEASNIEDKKYDILISYAVALTSDLQTFGIMPKWTHKSDLRLEETMYDIKVEGPYPEHILREAAQYVRDYSREEILLEPNLSAKKKQEALQLQEQYYIRLRQLQDKIQARSASSETPTVAVSAPEFDIMQAIAFSA